MTYARGLTRSMSESRESGAFFCGTGSTCEFLNIQHVQPSIFRYQRESIGYGLPTFQSLVIETRELLELVRVAIEP